MNYCPKCGEKFNKKDNFCSNCGFSRSSEKTRSSKKPKKESSKNIEYNKFKPFFNKKYLYILGFVLLIISLPIAILIKEVMNPKTGSTVNIISSTNASESVYSMSSCEDCSEIKIRKSNGNFQEFPLKKEENGLITSLFSDAKKYNGETGTTTLFNENKKDRVFNISLDISGSVIKKDEKDENLNSKNVYSDLIINELKSTLANKLSPGDDIVVRFYGPAHLDNPCRRSISIDYEGPLWQMDFNYSRRTKTILLEDPKDITKEQGDKEDYENNKNSYKTNSLNKTIEIIHNFYNSGLNNPNPACHTNTLITDHLTSILDDSNLSSYNEKHYILVNDGSFSFIPNFQSNNEVYIEPTSYETLNNFINNGEEFKINNDNLCQSKKETFTILGMDYENNFDYRQTVQKFFNTFLESCEVEFKNV